MAEFRRILEGNCTTLVVAEHLSQIGLYLWRKGIELLPFDQSEEEGARQLKRLWRFNRLESCFKDIWERGAKTGEILLYVKPLDDGLARIRYYDATQFDYERDDYGLKEVVIKPKEKDQSELRLTRTAIGGRAHGLGRVPAVVIQNRPTQAGRGLSEFAGYERSIERHDWLLEQLRGNVEYFGGPIFYSSRSVTELLDSGMVRRESISQQGGYGEILPVSERVRVKRVVGGLEPGEEIGFATPQAVSSEAFEWVKMYEVALRRSLGGVADTVDMINIDPVSRYALAITTGEVRAREYITNGIVPAFEMALAFAGVDLELRWRYLSQLYPDTANAQLTKSIVSRNLLRLGVNLRDSLQHIFPDKSADEITELLEGGFAYELLSGVATVRSSFTEDADIVNILKQYIKETTNERKYPPITDAERGKRLA